MPPARGFTLVETMVAALVLAAAAMTLVGSTHGSRGLANRAARRLAAVDSAAAVLAGARSACTAAPVAAPALVNVSVPVAGHPPERPVSVTIRLACAVR